MSELTALHIMNDFSDSSISRIAQNLIAHQGFEKVNWHACGFQQPQDLLDDFVQMGVGILDFSQGPSSVKKRIIKLRSYILENDIKLIHSHTPRAILFAAMAMPKHHRPIHLATKHILYRPDDRRLGWGYFLLDRLSLYPPDTLIPVSQTMKNEIMSFPFIKEKRVKVIRNAIDYEKYNCPECRTEIRDELGIPPASVALGYAGRIAPAKRLDLVFNALSIILKDQPEVLLVVMGQGEQRAELEILAANLGISHAIIWTGFRKDVPRLLAGIDIFVQPSSNEGLSLSLLEAMAAGKAVIATDVGGTSEVITDGETGLLIPSHSTAALEGSILRLVKDENLRDDLAAAGKKLVIDEFGNNKMMSAYWQIYEKYLTIK